nr:immunoglobulin heavy chain junction region [Mus musculus]
CARRGLGQGFAYW